MDKINQYKIYILDYMKGYSKKLISIIIFADLLMLVFNTMFNVISLYQMNISVFLRILGFILSILINNVIYLIFIRRVRNESIYIREVKDWDKRIYLQISCGILLSILQYMINIMFINNNGIGVALVKYIIDFVFVMIGFVVVAFIYDGYSKMSDLLKKSCAVLKSESYLILEMALIYAIYNIITTFITAYIPDTLRLLYLINIIIGASILSVFFTIFAAIYNEKYGEEKI